MGEYKHLPAYEKYRDLFDDESYQQQGDKLIAKMYEQIQTMQTLLSRANLAGISIIPEKIYLNANGGWEVSQGANTQNTLLSPMTPVEVVMGYFCTQPNNQTPEEAFFLLQPDIKKLQTIQIFAQYLHQAQQRISEIR